MGLAWRVSWRQLSVASFRCVVALGCVLHCDVLVSAQTHIFGPLTFAPNGRAEVIRQTITTDIAGLYVLRLTTHDVFPVVVTVNGAPIVTAADFKSQSRPPTPRRTSEKGPPVGASMTVDKPVRLRAGNNQLFMTFVGMPGSSVTVAIVGTNVDTTPPRITANVSPAPNANNWNNSNVTVSFSCSDESGIETCTGPVVVSGEGAAQSITGTAIDSAGNTASTTVVVNIDKMSPTVSAVRSPDANAYGWNNSPVEVQFAATDALSGVLEDSVTPPTTMIANGNNLEVTGSAQDRAGNTGSFSLGGINIDTQTPTITAEVVPASNSIGWHNQPASVRFRCHDAESGIAQCPAETVVSEGVETIVGVVNDFAGNTAAAQMVVRVDQTPPTLSVLSPADGTTVTDASVAITGSVFDGESGVALITCNGIQATVSATNFDCVVPLTVGPNTVSISSTDLAGNTGAARVVAIVRGDVLSLFLPVGAEPRVLQDQIPTSVRVMADASSLSGTVALELIQLDEFGHVQQNYGSMFDDGTHGDATSGDHIFTSLVTVMDNGPKTLLFDVAVYVDGAAVPDAPNSPLLFVFVRASESVYEAKADLVAALNAGSLPAAYSRLGEAFNAVRELDDSSPATLRAIAAALESCSPAETTDFYVRCVGVATFASGSAEFQFSFVRDPLGRWRVITW